MKTAVLRKIFKATREYQYYMGIKILMIIDVFWRKMQLVYNEISSFTWWRKEVGKWDLYPAKLSWHIKAKTLGEFIFSKLVPKERFKEVLKAEEMMPQILKYARNGRNIDKQKNNLHNLYLEFFHFIKKKIDYILSQKSLEM